MPEVNKALSSRTVSLSLLFIILLAFVIRIIALGHESIWLDEAHSVWVAHMSPVEIVRSVADDVHPPLYFLVLHYWILIAGDSEFAVRLLSVIFGTLSVAVIYFVGARLFNRATGLACALLLALTRMHIEFSQEARMYSLLVLLTLLSVLFFLKLLESRSKLTLILYILCSILLMHAHFYALFVIAAQNIFFLLLLFVNRGVFRRHLWRWIVAQVTLFVLFVPWLTALANQVMRVKENFWIARFGPWIFGQTLLEYSGTWTLVAIFLALAIYGLLALALNRRKIDAEAGLTAASEGGAALTTVQKTIFLLLWFLTPVLLPYIYSQISRPIYLPKYTLPGLIAFTVLAARGIMSIRPRHIRIFPLVLIITLTLIDLPGYYATPRKAYWRDAAHYLEASARPGDLVLFNQGYSELPFDYYSRRTDLIKKPFPDNSSKLTADNVRESIRRTVDGRDRVWLVRSLFDNKDPMSEMIPKEFVDYELKQHEKVLGVEIFLFEKK